MEATATAPQQLLTPLDLIPDGTLLGYSRRVSGVDALQEALRLHLEQVDRLQRQIVQLREAVVSSIAALLDARDSEISRHSHAVMDCAVMLADHLRLSQTDVEAIRLAALLHDVGKVGVADALLNKPGPLNSAEWSAMREHPAVAERILRGLPLPPATLAAIRHHHERFDGRGYPDGLAGDAIPLAARIVSVADSFHAMTSNRPYRRGRSLPDARAEVRRCAWTHFCPRVVDAFLELSARPSFRHSFAAA